MNIGNKTLYFFYKTLYVCNCIHSCLSQIFSHHITFVADTVSSHYSGQLCAIVTLNTELANAEPLRLAEKRAYIPVSLWSQRYHQPINTQSSFNVWFLFKDTLFNL